jgi:hypothetical protein
VSRIIILVVLSATLFAPTRGAYGQDTPWERTRADSLQLLHDQMVFAQASGPPTATVHPVTLALREAYALGLSRDQVDALVDIEEELSRAFVRFAMSVQDDVVRPSTWWADEPVDEVALRSASLRAAEKQVDAVLLLLHLRDRVFDVLTGEQKAQLLEAHQRDLEGHWEELMRRPPARPCTEGGSGGGGILTDRSQIVWSVTFGQDSARIDGLFVARVEDRHRSGVMIRPRPNVPPGAASGGSAGVWHLLFDRETRTAYVHDQAIELGQDNVVLVHGIDRLHDLPDVVGTLSIPARFYTGGCLDGEDWVDALRNHILSVRQISEYVGK